MNTRIGLSIALVLGISAIVSGQSPGSGEEAAVREAGKDYLLALQKGDLKALADFWTADGTWTDGSGKTVNMHDWLGKATSGERRSTGNSGNDTTIAGQRSIKVSDVVVRLIAPNVAEEEGNILSTTNDLGNGKGHYVAIWVKQDKRWKLNTVHEMHYGEETSSPLTSLDILAGQWSGTSNQSTIKVSTSWDATKKFMRREFSIVSGAASLAGTQELGWDPVSRQIKSWTFFTDGSRGEGLWKMEGNVWMVASTRILSDGTTSSSTQVYEFPDRNTMSWKTIRGSVDGQPTDDFEIIFKRASTAK
ncbi:MAG TPA: nuclear transport factor 2 family protein [Pirellulales bacterium]